MVEVKIGVQNAARELTVETTDSIEHIEEALASAVQEGRVFSISDVKGRRVLVPADRIAYVEVGGGVSGQVGFRSVAG